jgi:hypothetical protein
VRKDGQDAPHVVAPVNPDLHCHVAFSGVPPPALLEGAHIRHISQAVEISTQMKKLVVVWLPLERPDMNEVAVVPLVLLRRIVDHDHSLQRVGESSDLLQVFDPVLLMGIVIMWERATASRPEKLETIERSEDVRRHCGGVLRGRRGPDRHVETGDTELDEGPEVWT